MCSVFKLGAFKCHFGTQILYNNELQYLPFYECYKNHNTALLSLIFQMLHSDFYFDILVGPRVYFPLTTSMAVIHHSVVTCEFTIVMANCCISCRRIINISINPSLCDV